MCFVETQHVCIDVWVCVFGVAPGADGSVWEEAEGAKEPLHGGGTDEESSGNEARQRVQTEHPQAEEERDEGATCSRSVGVFNTIIYNIQHASPHTLSMEFVWTFSNCSFLTAGIEALVYFYSTFLWMKVAHKLSRTGCLYGNYRGVNYVNAEISQMFIYLSGWNEQFTASLCS